MKEGWKSSKLYEIGIVQTGTTPPSKIKEYYGDYIPFIKPPHFNTDGSIIYGNEGLSERGLSKGRLIKENSILMVCIGATIGKTGISDKPISCNQQINTFTPNKNHEPKFFYYLLSSSMFFKEVMKLSSQATLPMINKRKWQNIEVNYPPLPEQKQIVAILDQAFEAIDRAKTNIEKNIENANELFQSKLNEIFSQKGEGWEEKSLSEVCEVKDGTHDSPKYISKEIGIPFVTQKNILESGLSFGDTKFISLKDHNDFYRRSNVSLDDILFAMIGANRGMACIVDDNRTFSIKNVGLLKANEKFLSKFLLYYLKSPLAKKYVAENSSGSAQGFIGLGKLRIFPVPLPDYFKQSIIVNQLESLDDSIQILTVRYKNKIKYLEELKKSILQKAFAGELTGKELAVEVE